MKDADMMIDTVDAGMIAQRTNVGPAIDQILVAKMDNTIITPAVITRADDANMIGGEMINLIAIERAEPEMTIVEAH